MISKKLEMSENSVAPTLSTESPHEPPLRLNVEHKKEREKRKGFKRRLNRMVKSVKKLNRSRSVLGEQSHFEKNLFPWVPAVEQDWTDIRDELLAIMDRKHEFPNFHDIVADVSTITDDNSWKTFFFYSYGKKSEKNCQLCPKTWQSLQKIPGLITGMFSILEPGKHIPAHKGPYNGVLRLHLPLIIPEPRDQTGIRVEDQIFHWTEGEALIFDDSFEHEAWNGTDGIRVVLFVDFRKPLRFPANIFNWLLLNFAPFSPFIREGYERQRQWEKRFHTSS